MNPSTPVPDLATQWSFARSLYPIYSELAREFVLDVPPCEDLESGVDTPERESVEQAQQWLEDMDQRIQVHQLRQFLQTSALANEEGLLNLLRHHLAKITKSDSVRDKTDFLLVQYFSQTAPSRLDDNDVDLAYVTQSLEPVLGQVDLKTPVWLNALDRVLEAARRCPSLDKLLHGGVLAQGRKAKTQAGELFFLPIALVAFTRFGYLMRRVFFRLMLGDLNVILDGLSELEEKGVAHIDCRRAQFSAEEPITRLRMICQSWKVMFQAEYSSGSPLRMLVDLRASVDQALGRSPTPAGAADKNTEKPKAAKAAPAFAAEAAAAGVDSGAGVKPAAATAPRSASGPAAKFSPPRAEAPEFEVASEQAWDPESSSQPGKEE